ncbi:MAG: sugar phosphate isomerase/epimerase [Candidatus Pacebacteria bacterium]|nr:sugar phosphate isomerase/epimerase [Candidatus Paceibacterota bacterium]MDD3072396.1 sugar phosphate isomerase/epimerase [Candidatus Paceibacterota bacterium]MDD3729009.1 sugar phosphate isomerase/epimerase [Candidatus Paceibacterota bacterium]MDD4201620.1 sugar phosphate isomerase/epimerase [Candidatus Paceibacterota bacterium]MDD4467427.1 sugar phosphate isomerase/epimerase [Candidatus Paceibacterota bacterium]
MTKIAISNLAWRKSEDEKVFNIIRDLNVLNMEISPFRDASTLPEAKEQFYNETSKLLNQYGIHVAAFQALMFRYPEVSIFEGATARNKILKHLRGVLEFLNQIGATVAVFGSPKNKIRGTLPHNKAMGIAKDFFIQIAEQARLYNVIFCIEPTPTAYGADFICNTQEAVDFVKTISHRSLKINLDIGSSILNGEDIEKIINKNIDYVGHVHISEPYLKTINLSRPLHRSIARTLNDGNYNGFVSVEMRPSDRQNIKNISKIISFVKNIYQ